CKGLNWKLEFLKHFISHGETNEKTVDSPKTVIENFKAFSAERFERFCKVSIVDDN
ncbi:unnamed protein product, partial [Heterotrigona itama]